MGANEKTPHYSRVEAFMKKANQSTPEKPTEPTPAERILRCKINLEEQLEKMYDGFAVKITQFEIPKSEKEKPEFKLECMESGTVDLVQVADGAMDVSVVNTGDLICCGLRDAALQREVDKNNLDKFSDDCSRCGSSRTAPVTKADSIEPNQFNVDEDKLRTESEGKRYCAECKQEFRSWHIRNDGKLVKPEGHKPPNLAAIIEAQEEPDRPQDTARSQIQDGLMSAESMVGNLRIVQQLAVQGVVTSHEQRNQSNVQLEVQQAIRGFEQAKEACERLLLLLGS